MSDFVLDNSAAIFISRGTGRIGHADRFFAPELVDLEFANTLRKLILRERLDPALAAQYIEEWATNSLIRCPHAMLLPRIWDHRNNITPYDSAYVALAEVLRLPLVTADRRLAKASRAYCDVVEVGPQT